MDLSTFPAIVLLTQREPPNSTIPHVSLSYLEKSFRVLKYLVNDETRLDLQNEAKRKDYYDAIASWSRCLFDDELIRRHQFLEKCLWASVVPLLVDYQILPCELVKESTRKSNKKRHIVLVVGCQTPEIIRNRVAATVAIWRLIMSKTQSKGQKATIVFSGKCPPRRESVTFPCEAETMRDIFQQLLLADREPDDIIPKKNQLEVIPDTEASTSEANVQNFLSMMDRRGLLEGAVMWMVSSTFHLRRLAELSSKLQTLYPRRQPRQVILVGSESYLRVPNVAQNPAYVKSLVFELLCGLAKYKRFGGQT
jgi:hypothetical protein